MVCQPLSSALVAGSFVLPVENDPEIPPTNDAVPFPTEGTFVPVVGVPSGGTLLKFHWAMMSAKALMEPTRKMLTRTEVLFLAPVTERHLVLDCMPRFNS